MKGFKFKKTLAVILAIVLVIGISAGTAILVDKTSVPAMTTIKNGLSAYELASENGYTGTMQEWLKSLQGKSAYEIAVDGGYKGTEAEWTTALTKLANSNPVGIKTASFNNNGELVLTLSDDTNVNLGKAVGVDGKNGVNGTNGKDGKNGTDGKDGIGITDVDINGSGELVLSFSDEKTVNLGKVVGTSGMNGLSAYEIAVITGKTTATSEAEWIESLKGAKGDTGAQGPKGEDGAQGPKGDKGEAGAQGLKGDKGDTGATGNDGATPYIKNGNWWIGNTDTGISAQGPKGETGATGQTGATGAAGVTPHIDTNGNWWIGTVDTGIRANGKSAYEVALENNPNLTYEQWIESLKGSTGVNGKSAYELAVETGLISSTVSVADWLESLKGADGNDGISPVVRINPTTNEWEISIDGGINFTSTNVKATGEKGADGISPKIRINAETNEWEVSIDNGETYTSTGVKATGDKGADGQNGAKGDKGESAFEIAKRLGLTNKDNETAWIESLKGEKGATGATGPQGNPGTPGKDGVGIDNITLSNGVMTITLTNSEKVYRFENLKGADGITPQLIIEDGKWKVSYNNGNTYTELGDAKGSDGITPTITDDGYWKFGDNKTSFKAVAVDGKTPYIKNGTWWLGDEDTEIAVTGQNGENGKDGKTPEIGSNNNWWIDGIDTGKKAVAQDGANGQNGADGDGIVGITVNENNYLVIDMKYGEDIIIEKSIVGADGKDGNGIKSISLTANYELVIVTDNGTTNLGPIRGPQGPQGIQGVAGANGLTPILSLDENGNLSVKYGEDGTLTPLGNIKGPKGDKGEDGVDGKSAYELYKQAHPEYTGTLEDWLNSLKGTDGRGILKTEFSGTNFIVYYTDSTSETHDLSDMFGDPNEKEVLVYCLLSDGTYGVKADGIEKYEVTTIEIPETHNGIAVTQILANGFKDLTLLQTIVLNDNITVIGANAFYNCASLTSISIPETVTVIGKSAFSNCKSLSNIILPSQITSINQETFYNCASLTTISIPANVKSIGVKAFSQSGLTTVEISGSWTYTVKNITGSVTSSDAGPYAQTWTAESMTFTWNCANNINNAKYLNGSSALSVYQRYGGYEYQFNTLPANYELRKK